jgi:protein-tyrosine kinase
MSIQPKVLNFESPLADRRIGQLLLAEGKLTPEGTVRILRRQRERGVRFGEAALELGLLREDDLWQVIADQFEYSYLKRRSGQDYEELPTLYEPYSPALEVFRSVRNQLMCRWRSDTRKTLAIVSPRSGDGRSYVAAKLAMVFAQYGQRTLLVDGDLRNPGMNGQLPHEPGNLGLAGVLTGFPKDEAILKAPGHDSLFILPAGPPPADPLRILSRERLYDHLSSLAGHFEMVLVDTPAAAANPDFQALSGWARSALLVARQGQTRQSETLAIKRALRNAQCQLVGALVNAH